MSAQASEPSPPLRVLAAEDNLTNQLVLSTVMGIFGVELTLVDNGAKAVAAWRAGNFDLILMDIQMPEMDGYEATRQIKANPELKAIPIVAVTSYALSGDEQKTRDAGCDAYIAKPYSPRQMLAKVREILGS